MAEVEGFGCAFAYGETSASFTATTTGWTVVGELTDLTPPEEDTDDVETTHHGSSGKTRTFQAGLVTPGEFDVACHYDKTVFGTLRGIRGSEKNFRILLSDGSGVGWTGYIKSVAKEPDMEGLVITRVKGKVSGAQTLVTSTS